MAAGLELTDHTPAFFVAASNQLIYRPRSADMSSHSKIRMKKLRLFVWFWVYPS